MCMWKGGLDVCVCVWKGEQRYVCVWKGEWRYVCVWKGEWKYVCVWKGWMWGEFLKLNVFVCSNLNNSQPSYAHLTR